MRALITETVAGEHYQYVPLGRYVVRAPGVCGGRPTFKYTRIEITGTLERLAGGESIEQIVDGYRGRVSREAIIETIDVIQVTTPGIKYYTHADRQIRSVEL